MSYHRISTLEKLREVYGVRRSPTHSFLCLLVICTVAFFALPLPIPADGGKETAPQALAAYFGDSVLPNVVNVGLCPPPTTGAGYGGMPFVLTSQVDPQDGFAGADFSLDPESFRVRVQGQPSWVTPVCATLQPAVDAGELRTVLLVGDFGLGGSNRPRRIEIVGDVRTTAGDSLNGLVVRRVLSTDVGPRLLLAERFTPGDGIIDTSQPGDGSQGAYCPDAQTAVVVKLTFSGGVSGPNGGALQDDATAMAAIQLMATNALGQRVVLNPFALRDDDNDNHLDACFGPEVAELTLIRVAVDSHDFFGPQNAPNRAAAVPID